MNLEDGRKKLEEIFQIHTNNDDWIKISAEQYYEDQRELGYLRNFQDRVNNLKALELFGYRIMFYKLPC